MNKERRTAIAKIATDFGTLSAALVNALEEISAISDCEQFDADLNEIKDNEQETFDNMPESLQNGERGSTSSEAIGQLETAISGIDTLREALEQASA